MHIITGDLETVRGGAWWNVALTSKRKQAVRNRYDSSRWDCTHFLSKGSDIVTLTDMGVPSRDNSTPEKTHKVLSLKDPQ
jgi:hypothetical protein